VRQVLVTGGGRNIGRAVVERVNADDMKAVLFDLVEPDWPFDGRFIKVDLSDRGATQAALDQALDGDPITSIVNNVGIVRPASLEETRLEDFDVVMSVNVSCAIQCTKALLPAMRAAKFGRIVNVSSRSARGKALRTNYAASKAAMHGLALTWALELGPFGITANAVGPGSIETSLFHQNNPADSPRTKAIIDAIPAGRLGTTHEVAQAVAFFLDKRSSFISGQVVYVCGGLTAG